MSVSTHSVRNHSPTPRIVPSTKRHTLIRYTAAFVISIVIMTYCAKWQLVLHACACACTCSMQLLCHACVRNMVTNLLQLARGKFKTSQMGKSSLYHHHCVSPTIHVHVVTTALYNINYKNPNPQQSAMPSYLHLLNSIHLNSPDNSSLI